MANVARRAEQILLLLDQADQPVSRGTFETIVHDQLETPPLAGFTERLADWRGQLYNCLSVLGQQGFVVATDKGYVVTIEGQERAREISELLEV